jgi:hypothetical protein
MEKQLKEQAELLGKYQQRERSSLIAGVLQEKGVPAKVASLLPNDVEATPEAVGKWLDDWSDVFGVKMEDATPDGDGSSPQTAVVDSSAVEAIEQIQGFKSQPEQSLPTTPDGLEAAIKATNNPAELNDLIAQMSARGL